MTGTIWQVLDRQEWGIGMTIRRRPKAQLGPDSGRRFAFLHDKDQ